MGSIVELEAYHKQWRGNTRNMAFFAIIEMYDIQLESLEFDGINWMRVARGNWQTIEKITLALITRTLKKRIYLNGC